ncbi:purine-nucleoside phosphorylase [Mycoplasma zalophi]|uniref:purine-nucleoside phosphorylase n=1 Tax=Mycoplasma zalophi TaxID=191287 RepID=UPI0021C59C4A|nr:purine-nucleoside phosphorylase [Mycoplasma zalophi]MCU4117134.1 purine-nucleoside phosphorylase [Mycoplasma zalophi]
MTPHINAKDNEIAKYVLMPGDPLRAKYIAENYLTNVKLVSNVRNVFMYTGDYKGNKVSVCASGMGIPSIGIYAYELYNFYGVEAIVRVGSAGSYEKDLALYDLVLASSCYGENVSFRKAFSLPEEHMAFPNEILNLQIENNSKELNIDLKTLHIHSEDAFYTDENVETRKSRSNNAACVEMESYGLFTIAQKLNKKAACLLTISDNLVTKEYTTSDEREKSFNKMMELALSVAKDYQ